MKNIILGILGVLITIYVVCIGLNVYSIQTHQNQLNHTVSRVVEHTLKEMYGTEDITDAKEQLIREIKEGLGTNAVEVQIHQMDLQKGLLSVSVTEEISLITGNQKKITAEKIAIMERAVTEEPKVHITFMVDEEVYKEYQIVKGEVCPTPKALGEKFIGWIEYGKDKMSPVKEIGAVQEDTVYLAVMR